MTICWFQHHFDNLKVTFNKDHEQSTWKLEKKLTDRHRYAALNHEARAVYECTKLEGPGPEEAIIKIKMQ